MTDQDNDKKAADPSLEPSDPRKDVPRSGAGAGSALSAMLRKRQMRASRDVDPEPQSEAGELPETGTE